MLFDFIRYTYILYIQYNVSAPKYNSVLYSIVIVSFVTLIPAQIFERIIYLYPPFQFKFEGKPAGGILLSF